METRPRVLVVLLLLGLTETSPAPVSSASAEKLLELTAKLENLKSVLSQLDGLIEDEEGDEPSASKNTQHEITAFEPHISEDTSAERRETLVETPPVDEQQVLLEKLQSKLKVIEEAERERTHSQSQESDSEPAEFAHEQAESTHEQIVEPPATDPETDEPEMTLSEFLAGENHHMADIINRESLKRQFIDALGRERGESMQHSQGTQSDDDDTTEAGGYLEEKKRQYIKEVKDKLFDLELATKLYKEEIAANEQSKPIRTIISEGTFVPSDDADAPVPREERSFMIGDWKETPVSDDLLGAHTALDEVSQRIRSDIRYAKENHISVAEIIKALDDKKGKP